MGSLRAIREAAEAVRVRVVVQVNRRRELEVLGRICDRLARRCRGRKATGRIMMKAIAC